MKQSEGSHGVKQSEGNQSVKHAEGSHSVKQSAPVICTAGSRAVTL